MEQMSVYLLLFVIYLYSLLCKQEVDIAVIMCLFINVSKCYLHRKTKNCVYKIMRDSSVQLKRILIHLKLRKFLSPKSYKKCDQVDQCSNFQNMIFHT